MDTEKNNLFIWVVGIVLIVILGLWYLQSRPPKPNEDMVGQTVDAQGSQGSPIASTKTTTMKNKPQCPGFKLPEEGKKYFAKLQTSAGHINIELDADKVPYAVGNFVCLARNKFYDGVIFHRVIEGFMIQGGDPDGNGTGGPGYQFDDEEFSGKYNRGTVAMANAGHNTNGSQFFIMHKDYELQPNYVIFGHVVDGIETVDTIATAKTKFNGRENSTPVDPVKITSIEIIER